MILMFEENEIDDFDEEEDVLVELMMKLPVDLRSLVMVALAIATLMSASYFASDFKVDKSNSQVAAQSQQAFAGDL